MRWHEPAGEVSRRRAICLAAATTLGAALAPGTFRLLSAPVNPVPAGPATTLRSTLTLFGGALRVPGYVLWARNDRGVFSIQVTSESADVVDALYGIVLRTLQPLPPLPKGVH